MTEPVYDADPLSTLIVGFGRAGSLHLGSVLAWNRSRCCGSEDRPVWVTDAEDRRAALPTGAHWVAVHDVDVALAGRRATTVVHVCTRPATRVDVVRRYAGLGFRRFIVEKPLALTTEDVGVLRSLRDERGLQIMVVGNWLVSALTDRLVDVLRRPGRELQELRITQTKGRVARAVSRSESETVFDIEMPHSLGLAALLADHPLTVRSAQATDLVIGARRWPSLRSGCVEIEHPNGIRTRIASDLASPVRQRTVVARCRDARVIAHYPVCAQDNFGQLEVQGPDGEGGDHEFIWDDSFGRIVDQAYGQPWDDRLLRRSFELNAAVVSAIVEAKARAERRSDELTQRSRLV